MPLAGHALDLSYFHIDYEKQITSYLSDLTILNRESQFAGTGIIVRNPDPAFVADLVATKPIRGVLPNPGHAVRRWPHQQSRHDDRRGLRLHRARYTSTPGAARAIRRSASSPRTSPTYDVAITPAADRIDQLNTIYNPLSSRRGRPHLEQGRHSRGAVREPSGVYDNNLVSPVAEVDSRTTFDLNLSYHFQRSGFTDGLTIAVDAVNLLDEEPPFVNIAQSPNGGGGFRPDARQSGGQSLASRSQEVVIPRACPPGRCARF